MTQVAAVFRRRFCAEYRRSQSSRSDTPESKFERSWTLGSSGSGRRSSIEPAELPRSLERRREALVHRRRGFERLGERRRRVRAELGRADVRQGRRSRAPPPTAARTPRPRHGMPRRRARGGASRRDRLGSAGVRPSSQSWHHNGTRSASRRPRVRARSHPSGAAAGWPGAALMSSTCWGKAARSRRGRWRAARRVATSECVSEDDLDIDVGHWPLPVVCRSVSSRAVLTAEAVGATAR